MELYIKVIEENGKLKQ
jgi:hypothetical protein